MTDTVLAGTAGAPNQPEPNLVVLEIRVRIAKLDLADELVAAINTMRRVVRL